MRYVVVVPTYNEADNVPILLQRLAAIEPVPDVLVVDDASPDGTGAIADALAEADPRVHVLHRTGKRGYAPASRDGLRWALERGYDRVCTMDADLSHDPAALPAMLALAEGRGADLVIGSRYVPGGAIVADWGPTRLAISRFGSAYARTMLGVGVRDCTSGYRCYDRAALELISWSELRSDGYCFLIEILKDLDTADLTVAESPITYVDRTMGSSKISKTIVLEAFWRTTVWGVQRLLRPRRTPASA